jgi:uncharacterized protein
MSSRIYIDSSIVLEVLLRESDGQDWLDLDGSWTTSELSEIECRRTLDRIRLTEKLDNDEVATRLSELDILLRAMNIIKITPPILKGAKASFPTVVRSLDAIHLATATLSQCDMFLTRDRQQAVAAKALGLKTL